MRAARRIDRSDVRREARTSETLRRGAPVYGAAFLVAALCVASSTAHADDKNPNTAIALSGVGAGVSSALIVASFFTANDYSDINVPMLEIGLGTSLITPSLGQWYAHDWLTPGMGIRVGAAALATVAVATEERTLPCNADPTMNCHTLKGTGLALLGIAAIAYIGGTAWDVADAGDAVVRYNHRQLTYSLAPIMVHGGAGLAVGGTF